MPNLRSDIGDTAPLKELFAIFYHFSNTLSSHKLHNFISIVVFNIIFRNGEEWRRIRQSIAPKLMRPKIVEESIDNFNAVTKDAVARFVKLKEACGADADHMPDLEGEISKWSTESMF